jgi:hypothetical protein
MEARNWSSSTWTGNWALPVGQGNLTKLFLDPHLLDIPFDLKIVLVCGESDISEVLQLATGMQAGYYLMLFVSHVHWGSCGCFALQVAPRFESGRIRARPGNMISSHCKIAWIAKTIILFDQMIVEDPSWDNATRSVLFAQTWRCTCWRLFTNSVSCEHGDEVRGATVNTTHVKHANGSSCERHWLGNLNGFDLWNRYLCEVIHRVRQRRVKPRGMKRGVNSMHATGHMEARHGILTWNGNWSASGRVSRPSKLL